MATENASDPPAVGQLLHADMKNHVKTRIRREIGGMLESVDELRGLASALERFTDLSADSRPEEVQETATGIRAIATQTFVCASNASGISTRLQAWADIAGIVLPGDTDEIPEESSPD
jgi:hypothetical protein